MRQTGILVGRYTNTRGMQLRAPDGITEQKWEDTLQGVDVNPTPYHVSAMPPLHVQPEASTGPISQQQQQLLCLQLLQTYIRVTRSTCSTT